MAHIIAWQRTQNSLNDDGRDVFKNIKNTK